MGSASLHRFPAVQQQVSERRRRSHSHSLSHLESLSVIPMMLMIRELRMMMTFRKYPLKKNDRNRRVQICPPQQPHLANRSRMKGSLRAGMTTKKRRMRKRKKTPRFAAEGN